MIAIHKRKPELKLKPMNIIYRTINMLLSSFMGLKSKNGDR